MKKCELSIPGETRIALGVNEANRLHKYATAQAEMAALAGKHAVLAVLRLGKLLKDLKDATAHGEWGQLFKGESGDKSEPRFRFTPRMANKYMRCYQEAMARLDATERAVLYMGLSGEDVAQLPALMEKATGNAVTPRQMMLNLQVVKDGSKSAAQAARLAQHETILKNRGKGRASSPVSPEQAMMAAVAAVQPPPWKGVDMPDPGVVVATAAILVMTTGQVGADPTIRRLSALTAAVLRRLRKWSPHNDELAGTAPWVAEITELSTEQVPELKNVDGRVIFLSIRENLNP